MAVEWFLGINSVLGVDRTGIYGHSMVCAWAIEDGVVGRSTTPERRWVWQTREGHVVNVSLRRCCFRTSSTRPATPGRWWAVPAPM